MARSTELAPRLRLIVITDAAAAAPRSVLDVIRAAVRAGAPAIQLRDKNATARALLEAGRALQPIVHSAGALFFVNDRVDVALALGADGVHVGPDDIPVAAIRRAAPSQLIVGTSTDDPLKAPELVADGADYIGCGAVYATETKADVGTKICLEGLQRVVDAVDVPVVGIGGIDVQRSQAVATGTGAAGVAVVGAVMGASDVEAVVRQLLRPWS